MPQKEIRLRNNGANPDSQRLSINAQDTAEWVSDDNTYTVDFGTNSPFVRSSFTVRPVPGGSASSGPLKQGVQTGRYDYTVAQAAGTGGGADPDITVDP